MVIILPTIGEELDIPEARLQWILSAYSLTFGCLLLFWGRLADIYGKRKIFVLGSAWFAVTTLVNPFLKNEIAFDLFRGLQGLVGLSHSSLSDWFTLRSNFSQDLGGCGKRPNCYWHLGEHIPAEQGQKLCH